MRFDLSDEQKAIQSAARDFLGTRYDIRKVRELAETGNYDVSIWGEIADLGWTGLAIADEFGGQGLGMVELAVVLEEFGYALAPSPFLSNAAAGLLLQRAGSAAQKQRWLPAMASGKATATLGVLDGKGRALVPDAGIASVIILVDGQAARLVEGPVDKSTRVETLDLTRHYYPVEGEDGELLEGDVSGGMDLAEVALAAELVGVSQRAMEMAVEYAKVRTQFGRPIGAYQAVSHRCSTMLLETESARSATLYAAWAADSHPEAAPMAASVAKVAAADAGWHVTASALQVHGGIGFTWEHDLHLLLKRAKVDGHIFGSVSAHRERVAELSGLPSLVPEGVQGL
ncbi:MAG TPA: acyl-CoA dehydrogenase family protein [Candidatus Dormibacteraeota bacterium]|jgi:alkylation response protein AidB-like acyl-CoA dehydrogenase|nr:acyl-CoA dehydrogenase family protein [Candidatus Dormibacteraeota bacterium]